jgi:hypothetical protein
VKQAASRSRRPSAFCGNGMAKNQQIFLTHYFTQFAAQITLDALHRSLHGEVRPLHQKLSCLTQSTEEPCVLQIWSCDPEEIERSP